MEINDTLQALLLEKDLTIFALRSLKDSSFRIRKAFPEIQKGVSTFEDNKQNSNRKNLQFLTVLRLIQISRLISGTVRDRAKVIINH